MVTSLQNRTLKISIIIIERLRILLYIQCLDVSRKFANFRASHLGTMFAMKHETAKILRVVGAPVVKKCSTVMHGGAK
jgi:hypothetical protein